MSVAIVVELHNGTVPADAASIVIAVDVHDVDTIGTIADINAAIMWLLM